MNSMEERLKTYLAKMEEQVALWEKNSGQDIGEQEKKQMLDDMLIQIGFFQHERLIHLIVTVTFALLTIIAIMGTLIVPQPALFALVLLLCISQPILSTSLLSTTDCHTFHARLFSSQLQNCRFFCKMHDCQRDISAYTGSVSYNITTY